jgi:hypothetical protein
MHSERIFRTSVSLLFVKGGSFYGLAAQKSVNTSCLYRQRFIRIPVCAGNIELIGSRISDTVRYVACL